MLLKEWRDDVDSQNRISSTLVDTPSQDSLPNVEQPSVGHEEDIFIPDWSTLLHTASKAGKLKIVQSLLDGGADVNDRDAFHRTALILASRNGKFQVAQLLIKNEAEVNCPDGVGVGIELARLVIRPLLV